MSKKDFNSLIKSVTNKPKVEAPTQITKPTKTNKRDSETQYSFWLDTTLLKKLKKHAFKNETTVKDMIVELIEKEYN